MTPHDLWHEFGVDLAGEFAGVYLTLRGCTSQAKGLRGRGVAPYVVHSAASDLQNANVYQEVQA